MMRWLAESEKEEPFHVPNIELGHIVMHDMPRYIFHHRDEIFRYAQQDLADNPKAQNHVSLLLQQIYQLVSKAINTDDIFIDLTRPGHHVLDFDNL
ncbi:hypothetical protein PspLS_08798 [Pyricularia sp. CBS 133598]|nr:hypothetical protein PspLS_08798 [Pyricularia sp. CBS 133598]